MNQPSYEICSRIRIPVSQEEGEIVDVFEAEKILSEMEAKESRKIAPEPELSFDLSLTVETKPGSNNLLKQHYLIGPLSIVVISTVKLASSSN